MEAMSLLRRAPVLRLYTRSAAHWNKDWMPGPAPTTDEEVEKAAKKYGLLKEEYKVYPDDGYGIGDYPDIPPISAESRDIFYPWDMPESRRNYGEAMHHLSHLYTEDRYNVCIKPRLSATVMMAYFLGLMGSMYLMYELSWDMASLPAKPRQLGYTSETHYSFPKSASDDHHH